MSNNNVAKPVLPKANNAVRKGKFVAAGQGDMASCLGQTPGCRGGVCNGGGQCHG